jgi:hypothetical protein
MDSVNGALLHALAGYDARPSGMQTQVILLGTRLVKPAGKPAAA